jgi:hypothetical protein
LAASNLLHALRRVHYAPVGSALSVRTPLAVGQVIVEFVDAEAPSALRLVCE